jgi:hypothetical protein
MSRSTWFSMVVCTCVALFAYSTSAHAADIEQLTSGGVVQIFGLIEEDGKIGISSGTGFVINEEGYIGTNNHVVEGAVRLYANRDGATVNLVDAFKHPNLDVISRDANLDLAILRMRDASGLSGVTFTGALPKKGGVVYAIGYPGWADEISYNTDLTKHSDATFTQGVLSRSYQGPWGKRGAPAPIIQHNSEINHGNSGGPLVDECGRVIGVNTMGYGIDTGAGEVSIAGYYYASHIVKLLGMLDAQHIKYRFTSATCVPAAERFEGLLKTAVIAVVVGFILLGTLMVVFLRKPREQVVHAFENVSRRFVGRGENKAGARPARQQSANTLNIILEGRDSDTGTRYRAVVDRTQLESGRIVIGRDPGNADVVIDHPEVSRKHATMFWQGGRLEISDHGSTNGTTVNGRPVAPNARADVRHGDDIGFGTLSMRVIFG